jgi:hypothetical protein
MPEDLTHIHSNGLVQNREELFDRIGTVINFLHIERGELSYRMYGDVVVAVGPMHVRTRLIESGMESSSDAVVTQVWVRQDKGWTQVAFQSART